MFHANAIVRKGVFIKDVPELITKFLVALIAHFHHPILHTEGVLEVFPQWLALDLHAPALKILSVE